MINPIYPRDSRKTLFHKEKRLTQIILTENYIQWKRTIKTNAVKKHIPYDFDLVSGSADFVDFLVNGRDSFFYVRGNYFGGAEFRLDMKLSTEDAAMLKYASTEMQCKTIDQCLQLFGGYGYICEFPMEWMMRDAKITEIYEGTSEIQRLVIDSALIR